MSPDLQTCPSGQHRSLLGFQQLLPWQQLSEATQGKLSQACVLAVVASASLVSPPSGPAIEVASVPATTAPPRRSTSRRLRRPAANPRASSSSQ